MARHKIVKIPSSNMKKSITKLLYDNGYILKYKFDDQEGPQGTISIALKYNPVSLEPVIKNLTRVSKSGLRKYSGSKELPRVINGLGMAVISTSKGVMTDYDARKNNVGGEVLCYVY